MSRDADPIAARVRQWIRPEVRYLQAYHVQRADGFVKLDAMENPYSWPEELLEAWLARIRATPVNRYPDPQASAVKDALRAVMAVPPDQALLLGNGSDELIQLLALTLAGPDRVLMSPEPSFAMYRMSAVAAGMQFVGVPLNAQNFALDRGAMLAAVERYQPALIFLAYPNNPTGNLFDTSDIAAIMEAAPGLVVIDEAYAAFTDSSFMPRLGHYPNLVVMRTLSKLGLAGLRLGCLAGPAGWLDELEKLRLPYNINALSQVSVVFALENYAVFEAQTRRIREQRETFFHALSQIDGIAVWPSEANFLLVRVGPGQVQDKFEGLKAAGVLLKKLDGAHPRLDDCMRVTVGTAEENRLFVEALRGLA